MTTVATPVERVELANCEQFTLDSAEIGERFRIMVAKPNPPLPALAPRRLPRPERVPVLYTTDANGLFALQAQLAQLMQSGEDIPAMYVVGIGYDTAGSDVAQGFGKRQRDMTPTRNDTDAAAMGGMSGGADAFLRFIRNELMPLIDERYPVDHEQAGICGLSYGGLFALYALFEAPESFSTYLAIDPSNWDDWVALRLEAAFAEHPRPLAGRRVFIGIENPEGYEVVQAAVDRLRDTWCQFGATLAERGYDGLEVTTKVYDGESHFSVTGPAFVEGLRRLFPVPPLQLPAS